jgi:hypothetical protein
MVVSDQVSASMWAMFFSNLWLSRFVRSWRFRSVDSRHPDGYVLLVTVGKNGRRCGQKPDIFDCQPCLFHDFPLGASLEALAMFKMPTGMGDVTWKRISTMPPISKVMQSADQIQSFPSSCLSRCDCPYRF